MAGAGDGRGLYRRASDRKLYPGCFLTADHRSRLNPSDSTSHLGCGRCRITLDTGMGGTYNTSMSSNPYIEFGRHFPRYTLLYLRILRDGRPMHYLTVASIAGSSPRLAGAWLSHLTRIGQTARIKDLGRGFYAITNRGLRRLAYLEANDPGE